MKRFLLLILFSYSLMSLQKYENDITYTIPNDIWGLIININENYQLLFVNKKFYELHKNFLYRITLKDYYTINSRVFKKDIKSLNQFINIRQLKLKSEGNRHYNYIACLTNITYLEIQSICWLFAGHLKFLSNFEKLEVLKLKTPDLYHDQYNFYSNISNLTKLSYLSINHFYDIARTDYKNVKNIASLKRLDIPYCNCLKPLYGRPGPIRGMEFLSTLTQLEEICFLGCDFHEDALKYLSDLTGLKKLDLSHTGVTKKDIAILSNITNLKIIIKDKKPEVSNDLGPAGH